MKKLRRDTMDMVMTGTTMGIGSKVISGAGGDASAISGMSSHMGTIGMVSGMGGVIRQTKKMKLK
jgi:hypothetical protein